jgi:hypothetical protein
MPNLVRRIWSRRPLLDHQSQRTHQMRRLPLSQLSRQVVIISLPPFLTTSQVKPRSVWRVVGTDQVAENGVVKNRRRTLRLSARAVLTMDIVVDIGDEDVVVADTEAEDTVEMANQDEDVVDIEGAVMHKQPCSNCIFNRPKSYWTHRAFLTLYQKLFTIAMSVDMGKKKTANFLLLRTNSLLS